MAIGNVIEQVVTDRYAIYNADCMSVLKSLPSESVGFSVYSPPFQGLGYVYSSDERDLSNSVSDEEFWGHYDFIVKELHRVTMPGRMSAVHCADLATGNSGLDHCYDFPGDIIRQHERLGWHFCMRRHIWREPLTIRNRTMVKALSHKALTQDSTKLTIAHADQLLFFRRSGENAVPVAHEHGLLEYAGETPMPADILKYRNWQGSQLENRFSQWIWRRYASSVWDDVRIDRVLPYRQAREENDERHVHPLQLDVIERAVVLGSNPGETVLTPFMGVGSECFGAVINGRKAIGIELKPAYFAQAVKNLEAAQSVGWRATDRQEKLFSLDESMDGPEEMSEAPL
jgi:hypothetical protein